MQQNDNMNNPRDYGVPHDYWRPNQFAMYQQVEEIIKRGGGFIFGELGTGSGKSAIATAMGHADKVLVICHTLALLDQYKNTYGFSIVKGRQEYPCVFEEKVDGWESLYGITPTAADCTFSPMSSCPVAHNCPYLIAKNETVHAQRAACTYRYVAVSSLMKKRDGNIVFDEAHDAAEELIKFNEFAFRYSVLKKYNLPQFPIVGYSGLGKGATVTEGAMKIIITWMSDCIKQMGEYKQYEFEEERGLRRIYDKFIRTVGTLKRYNWFLQTHGDRFALRALSAEPIANAIFRHKSTKLLMSATIGDATPLANALGIREFETLTFEHPVPPDKRPIYDLGAPRMTARNIKQDKDIFKKQATLIWNWIQTMPPSWRGVILTSSYTKIEEIYRHLLIPNNIIPTKRRIQRQRPGEKVSKLVNSFVNDRQPGDIFVGTIQGWGSGLDLYGEIARWLVIAGVPHKNPTDEYAKARRALIGGASYEKWTVYNAIAQAAGRVSRGEVDVIEDWIPNFVAIADESAMTKTAMRYYGQWFIDAIRDAIIL